MKRIMTLGAVSAIGFATLAAGAVTSPASADTSCNFSTAIFIHYADGLGECTEGHNVTYGMPNRPVDFVISGSRSGWLSRRSNGAHVNFPTYKDITFSPAANFNYIHFN